MIKVENNVLRMSDRDVLIVVLRADGLSYDQIAKLVYVGKVRCRQIVKRFVDTGDKVSGLGKVVH